MPTPTDGHPALSSTNLVRGALSALKPQYLCGAHHVGTCQSAVVVGQHHPVRDLKQLLKLIIDNDVGWIVMIDEPTTNFIRPQRPICISTPILMEPTSEPTPNKDRSHITINSPHA